jgi:hypothetical protein
MKPVFMAAILLLLFADLLEAKFKMIWVPDGEKDMAMRAPGPDTCNMDRNILARW